jgi:TonB family protein
MIMKKILFGLYLIPIITFAQIYHGNLVHVGKQGDTVLVPMVVRQIDFDEYTSFSLVASDSIKPNTVGIIFAADELLGDSIARIINPFGSDIPLSLGMESQYANVVKEHKVVGISELSWDKFEQFCKLDPIRISTKRRTFDLNYNELEIVSAFHRYLIERVDEEQPPPDFIPYEVAPGVVRKADPRFPMEALRDNIEGDVVVKVWVDKRGRVRKVKVIKSSADIFLATSIEAAQQWVFNPAKIQGKPVSVWVAIPFRYRITGSR